jgi:hypothetical protein
MNGYMKECKNLMQQINEEREDGSTEFYQNNGANDALGLREIKKIYDTLRAEILPKSYDLLGSLTDARHACLLRREIIRAYKKHGVKKAYRNDLIHDGYQDLVTCLDFYGMWKDSGE